MQNSRSGVPSHTGPYSKVAGDKAIKIPLGDKATARGGGGGGVINHTNLNEMCEFTSKCFWF